MLEFYFDPDEILIDHQVRSELPAASVITKGSGSFVPITSKVNRFSGKVGRVEGESGSVGFVLLSAQCNVLELPMTLQKQPLHKKENKGFEFVIENNIFPLKLSFRFRDRFSSQVSAKGLWSSEVFLPVCKDLKVFVPLTNFEFSERGVIKGGVRHPLIHVAQPTENIFIQQLQIGVVRSLQESDERELDLIPFQFDLSRCIRWRDSLG